MIRFFFTTLVILRFAKASFCINCTEIVSQAYLVNNKISVIYIRSRYLLGIFKKELDSNGAIVLLNECEVNFDRSLVQIVIV